MDFRAWRRRLREYDEITNVRPILRRYFVIGAFDGSLTILGIIIVAFAVVDMHALKPFVVASSVGAAIGLAVSSAVGAYEAERVEKKLDIRTIERALLARLSEEHRDAFRFAAILSALIHGIAPLFAGLLPVVPFLFLDAQTSVLAAIAITLAILFVLGAYLGNLVRERAVWTGLRFVAAGVGTAVVLLLLGVRIV
jgi:predicted membrane protein (TIGR00267 family)